jgi:hypothetical protein
MLLMGFQRAVAGELQHSSSQQQLAGTAAAAARLPAAQQLLAFGPHHLHDCRLGVLSAAECIWWRQCLTPAVLAVCGSLLWVLQWCVLPGYSKRVQHSCEATQDEATAAAVMQRQQ